MKIDIEQVTLDYLRNPDAWPNLVLPVKRWRDGFLECGVVVAGNATIPIVFLVNMFALSDLSKAEKIAYENLEALVLDGWIVD